MRDLGLRCFVLGIARTTRTSSTALIIDEIDRHLTAEILAPWFASHGVADHHWKSDDDRIALARSVVKAGLQWASGS